MASESLNRLSLKINRDKKGNQIMIYANQARAEQVANELNAIPGYAPAKAILTSHGWTVIRSYYHASVDYSNIWSNR